MKSKLKKLITVRRRKLSFKARTIRRLTFLLLFILTLYLFDFRVQFLGIGTFGWCIIISILIFSLYKPKNLSTYGRNKKIFYTFVLVVILALSFERMMMSSRTFRAANARNTSGLTVRVESRYSSFSRDFGYANYFAQTFIIIHGLQRTEPGELVWRDEPEVFFPSNSFFDVNHFHTIDTNRYSPSHPVSFSTVRIDSSLALICNIIILGTAISTLRLFIRERREKRRHEVAEIFNDLL